MLYRRWRFDLSAERSPDEMRSLAHLIRTAPELLAMARSARNAFRERISCLKDDLREEFGDHDDIENQIANYTYLLKKCDEVIAKAEGRS